MEEEFYRMWKSGLATWEEYRNIIRAYRNATKKAKAHLELILAGGQGQQKRLF